MGHGQLGINTLSDNASLGIVLGIALHHSPEHFLVEPGIKIQRNDIAGCLIPPQLLPLHFQNDRGIRRVFKGVVPFSGILLQIVKFVIPSHPADVLIPMIHNHGTLAVSIVLPLSRLPGPVDKGRR